MAPGRVSDDDTHNRNPHSPPREAPLLACRAHVAFPAMASYLTSSHWIVTVPNELGSSKATLDCIAKGMQAAGDGRNLGGSSPTRPP